MLARRLVLALLVLPTQVWAAGLFDDQATLDIRLRGPLGTLIGHKTEREDYPFELQLGNRSLDVSVRVRGNSRIQLCRFPPLRIDVSDTDTDSTVLAGQGRLKLVTHCRNNDGRAENNVLDEYAAYRLFNLLTPFSYRVRLLRVTYEDTDGRQKDLERAYFAFLIESDTDLAARMDAEIARVKAVHYRLLDEQHTALTYVFQYLIGNSDYSLIPDDGNTYCCHNIDLFEVNGRLVTVPYDFDFSGLVNARYAEPDPKFRQISVTQRRYIGYCLSPMATVAAALQQIMDMKADILEQAQEVPALQPRDARERIGFLERFFKEAANPDRLLNVFDNDCIGHRR